MVDFVPPGDFSTDVAVDCAALAGGDLEESQCEAASVERNQRGEARTSNYSLIPLRRNSDHRGQEGQFMGWRT